MILNIRLYWPHTLIFLPGSFGEDCIGLLLGMLLSPPSVQLPPPTPVPPPPPPSSSASPKTNGIIHHYIINFLYFLFLAPHNFQFFPTVTKHMGSQTGIKST